MSFPFIPVVISFVQKFTHQVHIKTEKIHTDTAAKTKLILKIIVLKAKSSSWL